MRNTADIARAHGDHDVAARITPCRASPSSSTFSTNIGSTWPRERTTRQMARPSRAADGCLTGRVNLGHQQYIGLRQHATEVIDEVAGAGITVRLEGQYQAAVPG